MITIIQKYLKSFALKILVGCVNYSAAYAKNVVSVDAAIYV